MKPVLLSLVILVGLTSAASAQGVGRAQASNLTEVGCTGSQSVACSTPWVYCIDAECDANVEDKIAKCRCWKQAAGPSIAPSGDSGAPCVLNALGKTNADGQQYPTGNDICTAMGDGTLISTFGKDFKNTSYLPEFAYEYCEPRTPFAYCYGAPCVQDPTNADYAICDCPYVFSDSDLNQTLTVQKTQCTEGKSNICNSVLNDDPIDSKGESAYDLAKVVDSCETVRGDASSSTPASSAAADIFQPFVCALVAAIIALINS